MAETVYSLEQISAWQSHLKGFAKTPRTRFSKKQAVEAMIDEIEEALKTHPYEEVAEQLKGWGLDIAAGSLKQYVNAYRREHGTEVTAPAKKRSRRTATSKAKKTKQRSASQQTASQTDGGLKPVGNTQTDQTDVKAAKPKPKASESPFIEIDEEAI